MEQQTNQSINHRRYTFPAIPGEFNQWKNIHKDRSQQVYIKDMVLVVADLPGTGIGNVLSSNTKQVIQQIQQQTRSHIILYMNRGDNISFVKKAMLAQQAGASLCLIGNHVSQPWPYTMCDSTNEAQTFNLQIPTIMVSQQHGQMIQQLYFQQQHSSGHFNITGNVVVQMNESECCICAESYSSSIEHNNIIIQIQPGCGHYFHESCAIQWLQQHNTCPFCRYELPLEDKDREQQRLLQQRQQQENRNIDEYYG